MFKASPSETYKWQRIDTPSFENLIEVPGDNVTEHLKVIIEEQNLKITTLEAEVQNLKKELCAAKSMLDGFLTTEQIGNLNCDKNKWSHESIVLGFKFRFALGVYGYKFLRGTNYPLPSYSTLNRRVQDLKIEFGIFQDLLLPLENKVYTFNEFERDCAISIDEMQITGNSDYDKNKKEFVGDITLGMPGRDGNHITCALIRGITSPWKQVIACEITGASTNGADMKNFLCRIIHAVTEVGLNVRAVTTDMGSNNKAMWSSLGVVVNRTDRKTSFTYSNNKINVLPDVCHLLKNLKSAVLSTGLTLPDDVVADEGLPTNMVHGNHIQNLFRFEMANPSGLRSLFHLKSIDVNPDHYSKMNVGSAVKFFSVETAAALENAVRMGFLTQDALTTAFFLRLIWKWFEICASKCLKKAITQKNKLHKFEFLQSIIDMFQHIVVGKGWKPLNTGMIMATTALMEIAKESLERGYKFILLHRFTQDALENIFSQIRRKTSKAPSALQCIRALKSITIAQFISEIKNTMYLTESDAFLLEHTSGLSKERKANDASSNSVAIEPDDMAPSGVIEIPVADLSNLYYIAGAIINILPRKGVCDTCISLLIENENSSVPENVTHLVDYADLGGLKRANSRMFAVVKTCEQHFIQNQENILKGKQTFGAAFQNNVLFECNQEDFLCCCSVLKKIIAHYCTIRGFSMASYDREKKNKKNFATATAKIV